MEHSPSSAPQALLPPSPIADAGGDDDVDSLTLLRWARSLRPLHKALLGLLLGGAVCALAFSPVPLWRPLGLLLLRKLWDVLRFLLITTGIGLGIINSKLWSSGNEHKLRRRSGAISASDRGGDSVGDGFFYSELQPSYSFDEKASNNAENAIPSSTESEDDQVGKATVAAATEHSGRECGPEDASKLSNGATACVSSSAQAMTAGTDTAYCVSDAEINSGSHKCAIKEPPRGLISADSGMKMASPREKVYTTTKAYDDLSLGVGEHLKAGHKSMHRRGASLDIPIHQDAILHKQGYGSGTEMPRRLQDGANAGGNRSSSASSPSPPSRNAPSSQRQNASENIRDKVIEGSDSTSEPSSASAAMNMSRHSRSQSAHDFNDLLAVQQKPRQRRAGGGQLGRRRKVSLSCDLDNDYRAGRLPSWPEGLLSPPMPPHLVNKDANRGTMMPSQEEEGNSSTRAFKENLVPWRVETIGMPVVDEIPSGGRSAASRPDASKKKKAEAPSQGRTGQPTPPLSPSTPKFCMGSPSPSELNKKVDDFIARFHERNRLQRLESLERSRHKA